MKRRSAAVVAGVLVFGAGWSGVAAQTTTTTTIVVTDCIDESGQFVPCPTTTTRPTRLTTTTRAQTTTTTRPTTEPADGEGIDLRCDIVVIEPDGRVRVPPGCPVPPVPTTTAVPPGAQPTSSGGGGPSGATQAPVAEATPARNIAVTG